MRGISSEQTLVCIEAGLISSGWLGQETRHEPRLHGVKLNNHGLRFQHHTKFLVHLVLHFARQVKDLATRGTPTVH